MKSILTMLLVMCLSVVCLPCLTHGQDVPVPKVVPQPNTTTVWKIDALTVTAAPSKQAPAKAVGVGMHSHTCPNGHIWSHSDDSFGNVQAHMCPLCGAGPVWNKDIAKFPNTSRPVEAFPLMAIPRTKSSCPGGVCPVPSRTYSTPRIFRR
jgi:hypothetical protein